MPGSIEDPTASDMKFMNKNGNSEDEYEHGSLTGLKPRFNGAELKK